MRKKLIIFDLDGTLFDTSATNYNAYRQALNEVGCNIDQEFYNTKCNGRYYKDFLPEILGREKLDLMEQIHCRKKELYAHFLDKSREHPELFKWMHLLRPEYYLALVTTASQDNCYKILRYFKKEQEFDLILTHEDVDKKKPDPEGFLKAMAHFGVVPSDTVVFEDSDFGIDAALRAGTNVLRVINFI